MANILIIDDNADDRKLFKRLLPDTLGSAQEAATLAEAYTLLDSAKRQLDVILLDVHLPDGPGPRGESWDAVESLSSYAPVIVVSATSLTDDPNLGRFAREKGAAGFTSKELIIFSPENLARQLDWVTSQPARSLAKAVKNPASPVAEGYDPNSTTALIARLLTQQEAMHAENQSNALERQRQLNRIEEQVKLTNGRVTRVETRADALESGNNDREKMLKTARWVGGIAVTIILFLFGPTLRERAFLDNEAVKKIAEEQVAKAIKTGVAPPPSNP